MDNVKVQNIENMNNENIGARDENKEEPIGEEDKDEGDEEIFFLRFTNYPQKIYMTLMFSFSSFQTHNVCYFGG
jgi:hypothetical protein